MPQFALGVGSHKTVGKLKETLVHVPGVDLWQSMQTIYATAHGPFALVGGDILLPKAKSVDWQTQSTIGIGLQPYGLGVGSRSHLWSNGRIPYVFGDNQVKSVAVEAMRHWQKYTPLRFRRHSSETSYIRFSMEQGINAATLGRQIGENPVWLTSNATLGVAIHEIGHVVGLWHENARSDRDEYIRVNFSKIEIKDREQFGQIVDGLEDLGDYDFQSIMHYPPDAFAIEDGEVTIEALNGEAFGQREALSDGDIAAVQHLYPSLDWRGSEFLG